MAFSKLDFFSETLQMGMSMHVLLPRLTQAQRDRLMALSLVACAGDVAVDIWNSPNFRRIANWWRFQSRPALGIEWSPHP